MIARGLSLTFMIGLINATYVNEGERKLLSEKESLLWESFGVATSKSTPNAHALTWLLQPRKFSIDSRAHELNY